MLTYQYTAREAKTGSKVTSEIQAASESAAAKLISEQGFVPIDIHLKKDGFSLLGNRSNKIKSKDRVLFARQLSTLINAGLPLLQSLRSVQEQTTSKGLKVVIAEVIADVEGGSALSKALERHPTVFNTVFTSLVAAGETSGTLDKALERIATQQEKDAEVIAKVRGALIYPAIVLFVISLVVVFMLVTVLPQVEQLYDDLNRTLPLLTKVLLAISNIFTKYWYLLLIIIIASIYFGVQYFKTEGGQRVGDMLKMRFPIFGRLFMKLYMARFSRTASTLTSSGVPMLEMLKITGNSVNNVYVEESTFKAAEKVKSGTALSVALKGDEYFLELVPQMIKIGEDSGSLDQMFEKTASYYERELDNEIKSISTTIEPALMVVLGLVAGVLVGAILLPVYSLVGETITL